MAFCLRPKLHSDDDESDSFPPSGSPLASSVDSDVFQQESAFGSFNPGASGPVWPLASPRRLRFQSSSSSKSSQRSSSSDSDKPSRQGSVKKMVRTLSSILRSRSDGEDFELAFQPAGSLLHDMTEALLHVYRTNTFPSEGLYMCHQKLTALVMSGGGGSLTLTWRQEVVPAGTRMLAVRVASPRDGNRVAALLEAWSCLYMTTLPLLQAILAPFSSLNARKDVLLAFRESVVPYADLPAVIQSDPPISAADCWKLKQMLLLLASLGPCECDLAADSSPGPQDIENDTEESQRERGDSGEKEEEEAKEEMIIPGKSQGHTNEILEIMMSPEMESNNLSAPVLQRLLHLHHGGQRDLYNPIFGLRLEVPPPSGPLVLRNLSSAATLEDLMRSAASR